MTEKKGTDNANVPKLVEDSLSQVAEIERSSGELLELMAGGQASPDFVHKVLRLSDAVQAAAKKVDLGYTHVNSLVDCKAGGDMTFQERRQQAEKALLAKQHSAGASTLPEVLESVRSGSGLEVACISYPPSACDLVETPIAMKGVDAADATEVWLVLPKVMRAAVGLADRGDPSPVTVAVFGPNEGGAGKDAWGTSEFLVFRRIAAIAMRVMKYYQEQDDRNQGSRGDAIRNLLLWLCSYRDLFSKPCDALKTLLVADSSTRHMVPPLFRPYRRPWVELQDAALGKHSVAYHMVSAPTSVL